MYLVTIMKAKYKEYIFRKYKKYFEISPSAINRGINLRLDKPKNRVYLSIGANSIVAGNFVFESEEGKISIGSHSYIGGGTYISRSSIEIGDNVTIAWGGTVYDHDSHSLDHIMRRKDIDKELECVRSGKNMIQTKEWNCVKSAPIKICNDAWIGMFVTILKGVTIGEGAVVGACSVVTKDVPAWTVVAGNPAKLVNTLKQ